MVVVVVVAHSWLGPFPKASSALSRASAFFKAPEPGCSPGSIPFPRLDPHLQILQDLEDCSWEVGDNCDPLSPLKHPVGLLRGLRSNRCYCWVCLFQGLFQHLPAVVDHIVDTMVKNMVSSFPPLPSFAQVR